MKKPSSLKITTRIVKMLISLWKKMAFSKKAYKNTEHASSSVEAEERLPDYGACGAPAARDGPRGG